ncbi:cell division protein FtsX [Alteraurantiacibacter palmitatis]|uniref:Cell division protein FtsX n=1 Tax=Alteraurantiacibacter palmitatis TaxID=2054628 RepID=A0ABV7E985_9SPHN
MSWRRHADRLGGDAARILPQARLAGPMPWVIAIMTSLTVIALAGGLALANLAEQARSEIAGGLTVQVVEANRAERDRQAETAIAILSARDDVASVRRVSEEELAKLIEPWLGGAGAGGSAGAIPTPALIDVRLRGAVTEARLTDLRSTLATQAPAARVDAQAEWLRPVFGAITSLQYLALGLVLLLAATSAAAVWLAARSALGTNRDTIEVIHHLGGTDSQIAAIFQRAIGLDAMAGGAAGLVLALGAILLLGQQFAGLGSGLVAGGGLGPVDWVLIACVPLAGVALAMLTARLTVLAALRRSL